MGMANGSSANELVGHPLQASEAPLQVEAAIRDIRGRSVCGCAYERVVMAEVTDPAEVLALILTKVMGFLCFLKMTCQLRILLLLLMSQLFPLKAKSSGTVMTEFLAVEAQVMTYRSKETLEHVRAVREFCARSMVTQVRR